MNLTLANLLQMARFTVQSPREGARMVMALNVPVEARWVALALMAVGSAMLTALSLALLPPEVMALAGPQLPRPLVSAGLQLCALVVAVHATYRIGKWRGGHGSFADALLLIVWLQFILLILQAAQLLAQVLLPPLSDLIGLAGIALFFWLMTNFVAELHGFQSLLSVFLGILATTFLFGLVLAMLLLPFVAGMEGI